MMTTASSTRGGPGDLGPEGGTLHDVVVEESEGWDHFFVSTRVEGASSKPRSASTVVVDTACHWWALMQR